jgi:hypothetical protein
MHQAPKLHFLADALELPETHSRALAGRRYFKHFLWECLEKRINAGHARPLAERVLQDQQ